MLTKAEQEDLEAQTLAPYAMRSRETRGRDHPLVPDDIRTDFQRDRDRIIHCAAFRKLEYKTQVHFVQEGDYYRTRLTHTLEVAQIGRSLARNLRLNVDLAEAIALAHDLGHTPFGHAGERALRRMMAAHGGFEHNAQGLRVVEKLETRYPEFPGLNLTWEVREGIIKHTTSYDAPDFGRFDPELAPTLEAQIIELADEIAFNSHDIDDALAMGLIAEHDLRAIDWFWEIWERAKRGCPPEASADYVKYRAIGRMIEMMMQDALAATEANLARYNVRTMEDVRANAAAPPKDSLANVAVPDDVRANTVARQEGANPSTPLRLARFSDSLLQNNIQLRGFLLKNVYRHPHVIRTTTKAEGFIDRLFSLYQSVPAQLPLEHQRRIEEDGLERVIADFLSGMSDRFLISDYIRAFEPDGFLRT